MAALASVTPWRIAGRTLLGWIQAPIIVRDQTAPRPQKPTQGQEQSLSARIHTESVRRTGLFDCKEQFHVKFPALVFGIVGNLTGSVCSSAVKIFTLRMRRLPLTSFFITACIPLYPLLSATIRHIATSFDRYAVC
eukprot:6176305-Pleurochrysis_carterae.AAC.1